MLQLKLHGLLQLEVYVDAAFASHVDSKSQSGIVVFLGGAMVFGASWKQKCMMKLPMESKLVTLMDHISFAEAFTELFGFIVGEEAKAPTIYQDSTSVISLVIKGGGVIRTKHLHAQMNLCQEAVQEKRIKVDYIHTSKMLADGLMKVFEGKEFTLTTTVYLELKQNKKTGGRWSFCAPEPVDLFCLVQFHVAVGIRSNEDPSGDHLYLECLCNERLLS